MAVLGERCAVDLGGEQVDLTNDLGGDVPVILLITARQRLIRAETLRANYIHGGQVVVCPDLLDNRCERQGLILGQLRKHLAIENDVRLTKWE